MISSQLLEILVIAMVAGIILFRLYSVLGRRTGNERPPQDSRFSVNPPAARAADAGNVVPLPAARIAARPSAEMPGGPAGQGLLDIKLADRNFEPEHFLSGARKAYEMIVTAFAKGDRTALTPLLSSEVLTAFEAGIAAREARHETENFSFMGVKEAKITQAALRGRMAEITVSFEAQFVSSVTNEAGAVVSGDPKAVRDVTDVWTFSRDVRANDPNWLLIATSGEEP